MPLVLSKIGTTYVFCAIIACSVLFALRSFFKKGPYVNFDSIDYPLHTGYDHILPIKSRNDIGEMLENLTFKVGAELGVQQGFNAEVILEKWQSCEKFYLVDAWRPLKNYLEGDLMEQRDHDAMYDETVIRLIQWEEKTIYYRMFTNDAVKYFKDESLDFIYLDARHDYCAARVDIENYWPKIRQGGIFAGHDYISSVEVNSEELDWGLCEDGTRHEGGVKRAVDEFVIKHQLPLTVTYKDTAGNSWLFRKPILTKNNTKNRT